MTDVTYLTLDDVVGLVRALKVGPMKDIGLLDSAVARPRASAFGDDAYGTIPLKAAALLQSLAKNHALVDGNKRVAWLGATVFLRINEWTCELDDDAAFTLVWDISSMHLELSGIATRMSAVPR